MELQQHYRELRLPVTIITGADDQNADVGRQSERLHRELPQSEFIALLGSVTWCITWLPKQSPVL